MTKPNKKVTDAIEGIQPAVKILRELNASCMEQVIDKAGIVCERWLLPNGRHVIVFGTPHWRDVFYPTVGEKWTDVEKTLREFILAKPPKLAYGSMQVSDT